MPPHPPLPRIVLFNNIVANGTSFQKKNPRFRESQPTADENYGGLRHKVHHRGICVKLIKRRIVAPIF